MTRRLGRHLTEEEWRNLVLGKLSRADERRGIRHLIADCLECQQNAARAFMEFPELLLSEDAAARDITIRQYVREFTATLVEVPERQIQLANEKVLAMGKVASLISMTPDERREAIRSQKYFQTFGLFERLLEFSRWAHRHDVRQAIELAELAHVVAESLDPKEFPDALRFDYQASALAHVANANRIAGEILAAEVALHSAWKRLAEGSGDRKEEALLHRHQANLYLELRRFDEAYASYLRAYNIYVEIDEPHLQGRTLVQESIAIGFLEPEKGLALAEAALTLIDHEQEPRALLCARHQIIFCLNEMGRTEEAAIVLEMSRKLYKQFGDGPTMARLHWIEARISLARGHLHEAELVLRQIWAQFEKAQVPIDLTLLTIDIVEVLVTQGKSEEAIMLIDRFYPALEDFHMHREGLAMWLLLRKAVAQQTFKENMFKEMGRYYYQAWREPLQPQVH